MLWLLWAGCASRPATTPSPPSPPPPPPTPPGEACDVRVYVVRGAGALPVHDQPGGKQAGSIPAYTHGETLSGGPILHLTRSVEGWVHYDEREKYGTPVDGAAPSPASGWIAVDQLAVDLAMSEVSPALMEPWKVHLRTEPSADAAVVRSYLQETHQARVRSCKGTWIQAAVTVSEESSSATGWLADHDHCGHPFTTCGKSRPDQ